MPSNGLTPPEGYVSRKELARELGCSHTAVCDAIKAGTIPQSVILTQGKHSFLNREQAIAAWATNRPFSGRGNYNPKLHERLVKDANPAANIGAIQDDKVAANKARTGTAIIDYKLKALQLQKEEGALVDRDSVNRALFAAGDEIKQAVLALPARIVDEIIALQGDRHKIIRLMEDNLIQVLLKLSDAAQQINQVMNNGKNK